MDNEAETETICCNKPMEEVKVFTSDIGEEKHVPVVKIKGDKAFIQIGSKLHPSEINHHIKIIALSFSDGFFVKYLTSYDKPLIKVPIGKGKTLCAAYCYCNVHGWWKLSLDVEANKKKKG